MRLDARATDGGAESTYESFDKRPRGSAVVRRDVVRARLGDLVNGFGRYVDRYDKLAPFSSEQALAHRSTIAALQAAGGVDAALADRAFVAGLYRTLKAWRLGMRASYLMPADEFFHALQRSREAITELESFRIDDSNPPDDIADRIWHVIDDLRVVTNKARLVAGTKTLHHLLPDLVVPMDREWTGTFFALHASEWQNDQRRAFHRLHTSFAEVARATNPAAHVTGVGWRTSCTKILDNAVIAYCQTKLSNNQRNQPTRQVTFTVPGLPPAKSEALSMLGAGHSHAARVRSLLQAAQEAAEQQAFTSLHHEPVALELVVHVAPGERLSDATNVLGGVADVLENKTTRGTLAHLGDLATVWLYENDKQIKQVAYRESADQRSFYTVTISMIT